MITLKGLHPANVCLCSISPPELFSSFPVERSQKTTASLVVVVWKEIKINVYFLKLINATISGAELLFAFVAAYANDINWIFLYILI